MNSDSARVQMVNQQVRAWEVLDPRVLDTMASVSREQFVPPEFRKLAFADTRIPLGHGEQMLAPKVVGRLLQALDLASSDSVLEVGTGSGYVTACLAQLAGPIRSIDIHDDFIAMARENLAPLGRDRLTLAVDDAMALQSRTRYDAIALTGSLPSYDARFQNALNVGGRLFVVVGREPIMEARLVTRIGEDQWVSDSLFETLINPLVNAVAPREFVF